jgi:PAS domain S-box-containing protein
MTNFQLELLRLLLFLFLWGYLWRVAGREGIREESQWSYVFLGFGLMFLGFAMSLTEDFPVFDRFVLLGSSSYASFLKNAVIFPLGFISVIIGIGKLLPKVGALRNAETALRESQQSLEQRVLERTAELESANHRLLREISERKEAEESLRKSEERFRLHFENANEVIFSYDTEFRILEVSQAVERVLGCKPEELVGKRIYDLNFIVPEDKGKSMDEARQVLAGRRIASSAYTFIAKDGTRRFGEVSGAPIRRGGKIVGVVSVARDITQRRETEQALWESEQKYRSIIENVREGYYEVDLAGNMILCNESMARILDYTKDELLGMNNRRYMTERVARKVYRIFNEVFATGKPAEVAGWELIDKHGNTRYVEVSVSRKTDSAGDPDGFWGIVRDVTERIQAEQALREAHDKLEKSVENRTAELRKSNEQLKDEMGRRRIAQEALRESEERYRLLAEHSLTGIYTHQCGKFTYVNQRLADMMGYSVDEVIGQQFWQFVHPEDRETIKQRGLAISEGHRLEPIVEFRVLCKNGSFKWFEVLSHPVTHLGSTANMGNVMDITERKRAEEKITASLKEKEILLREIHHRVKNNLQLMSSMLELQSSFSEARPGVDMLQDAQNRIRAMAVAHETLYRSGDLGNITSRDYLSRLADYLYGALGSGLGDVDLQLDIDDVPLKIDAAINCGLIVSELVSNCFKHAFPDAGVGEVLVSFKLTSPGEIAMKVRDNGVGVPADLDLRNLSTFGLELVTLLVQEMDGKIDLNRDDFTEFHIKLCVG